jgi:shikimate dehydrogenase
MKRPDPLQTALCGILLHPAGHTRSPAMHRAAYEALGLNAHYQAFDVPAEGLEAAVLGVRALGLRQISVSIPHKEAMLALVDEVDEVATRIGAINTVTRVGDRLVGTNTDWLGAVRAIERETTIAGRRAVVLGAGGTARALIFGLRKRGAEVFVLNRTRERAEEVARDLGAQGFGGLDELAALAPELIVQTTSVGLREDRSPVDRDALPRGVVALDAVYAPERTRLLADVVARGGHPISGKWMLVHQAVEQLRLWTRELPDPPDTSALARATEVMAAAFDDAAQPS